MAESKPPRRSRAVPWRTSLGERVAGAAGPPAYVKRALRTEAAVEKFWALVAAEYTRRRVFVELREREVATATTAAAARRARLRLVATVQRFNDRWAAWTAAQPDYEAINAEIAAFNLHYPVERLAALRYVPLNRADFTPREPIDAQEVLRRYPRLSLPTRP